MQEKLPLTLMVIVVNACGRSSFPGSCYFMTTVLRRWAELFPQHRFYVLHYKDVGVPGLPATITPLPVQRGPLAARFHIPALLKKLDARLLLSRDPLHVPHTRVLQYLVWEGAASGPEDRSFGGWLRHQRAGDGLRRVKGVVVFSEWSKKSLAERYRLPLPKIMVVPQPPREGFALLDFEEAAGIKEKYTGGKEYFLYAGPVPAPDGLVPLLKAFSLFKKRQKTSMKLVLAGEEVTGNKALGPLLATYKFREDVVVPADCSGREANALLGAAYAFITLSADGAPVPEALRCGVPVLLPAGTEAEELVQEAGLYFETGQVADIADKMMQVYRDESLRDRLAAEGQEKVRPLTWDNSARLLWQAVVEAEK